MRPEIKKRALAAILPALFAFSAQADPQLHFPVDCDLGENCVVQRYVDVQPGPGAVDFACGSATGEAHSGTDIALRNLKDLAQGVDVLAAAPGVVLGLRDGQPDQIVTEANRAQTKGVECGNGVALDHGDGWVTQYCHLAKGSITVNVGEAVASGQPLGKVGLSGLTQFPHLHFSVRHKGAEIDPYDPDAATCDIATPRQLWLEPLTYQPGGIKQVGFASAVPDYARIKAGIAAESGFTTQAPALVLWGDFYEAEAGDILSFRLTGPNGTLLEDEAPQVKSQAQNFRAIGRRRPSGGWPTGRYTGEVRHLRGGHELDHKSISITID